VVFNPVFPGPSPTLTPFLTPQTELKRTFFFFDALCMPVVQRYDFPFFSSIHRVKGVSSGPTSPDSPVWESCPGAPRSPPYLPSYQMTAGSFFFGVGAGRVGDRDVAPYFSPGVRPLC